ncbi:hypothetical protein E4U57_005986 [Claviceps arundinis]|uniref:Uncharacterized protein n=1 Tax=Claviceps arundinis TaxID=1623583 RepID=A0ABQ7P4H4_9HYPO|nr:hypothetical protein E4U57_005986 [Claviceps arundinis]
MENLTISDAPPQGGQAAAAPLAPASHAPAQLPPQMFTTAAQLLDLTDSKGPHIGEAGYSKLTMEFFLLREAHGRVT